MGSRQSQANQIVDFLLMWVDAPVEVIPLGHSTREIVVIVLGASLRKW